jgi:hypothetical protein
MKGLSMGDVDDIIAIYAYAKFYDDVTVFIVNDSPTDAVKDRCIAFIDFVKQEGYPPPENVEIICDDNTNLERLFDAADDIFWFAPIAYEPAKPRPLNSAEENALARAAASAANPASSSSPPRRRLRACTSSAADARQCARWCACASPRGRWRSQLCGAIARHGGSWADASVSPVIRQTLLHWAYELTEADMRAHAAAVAGR